MWKQTTRKKLEIKICKNNFRFEMQFSIGSFPPGNPCIALAGLDSPLNPFVCFPPNHENIWENKASFCSAREMGS